MLVSAWCVLVRCRDGGPRGTGWKRYGTTKTRWGGQNGRREAPELSGLCFVVVFCAPQTVRAFALIEARTGNARLGWLFGWPIGEN